MMTDASPVYDLSLKIEGRKGLAEPSPDLCNPPAGVLVEPGTL